MYDGPKNAKEHTANHQLRNQISVWNKAFTSCRYSPQIQELPSKVVMQYELYLMAI